MAGADSGKVEVQVAPGRSMTFRRVGSYSEVRSLRGGAASFLDVVRRGVGNLRPFAGLDDASIRAAYVVADLSLEPKLGQVEALKLASNQGLLFDKIVRALEGSDELDQ